MNLAEWHAVLRTEPLTGCQLGALLGEFRRLGLDGADDRAERLAVCAAILGLDELASTRDLAMGDAGRLLRVLRDCDDRAELPALQPAAVPAEQPAPPRLSLVQALARALLQAGISPADVTHPATVTDQRPGS